MDKKLGKNLILNVLYHILTLIVPFITAPYLGRVLGAEQIGAYTYIQSICTYFILFGTLGLSNYGSRTIAKVRDDRYLRSKCFWEIYSMQIITSLLSCILYIIYAFFISKKYNAEMGIMTIYVVSMMLDSGWYCLGTEKFKDIVIRSTCIKFINLICIFLFVRSQNSFTAYVTIMAICQIISQISLWPTVLHDIQWVKPVWSQVLPHFKPNFLLFIPAIAASIYGIMDKIMIGFISTKSNLAYYEYANKIVEIPNLIFNAAGTVMLSRMSHIMSHDKESSGQLIGYSMDLSLVIASGGALGIFAIADELVEVYYGIQFMPSANVLKILAVTVLFYAWSNVIRMQYIIPNNKDNIYILATFMGAIVNLIINFCLIPRYMSVGAAIGTVAAQFVVMLVYSFYSYKEVPLKYIFLRNIPIIVAGCIMMQFIKLLQNYHEVSWRGLLIDVVIGCALFVILCVGASFIFKSHILGIINCKFLRKR